MSDEVIKDDEIQEAPAATPEEVAAAWENYVRQEVNQVLNIFLPEAINGNVGVKYIRPVLRVDPSTGQKISDQNKATGVQIFVEFDFAEPIEFFDELPDESQPPE